LPEGFSGGEFISWLFYHVEPLPARLATAENLWYSVKQSKKGGPDMDPQLFHVGEFHQKSWLLCAFPV